ncbi:helix-turn-helix transcriptional regulator [Yeosuana sp. MJ-SS3]|uniref:Helix-turn-helix transcriptional regulator n=1 Tax=Gilvirhabdus luticola TaxID=3079858 RepID=A0ABU3U6X7_9FLAO|nr:helix-turn-helix transcriptional regulator [Yeosuana sp. MJ-SS3]MDU8886162.1 helix-turn-helix transcriptional regulator [Yeosuana sp. MJ-SS3]
MINNDAFAKRLQKVIDYYGESSSSFAEKIGVQRSSISHILSGRNKPSLDFVLKILSSYPEVEMYWLLNGKGVFPTNSGKEISILSKTNSSKNRIEKSKVINRIVIFYSDGSFEDFEK